MGEVGSRLRECEGRRRGKGREEGGTRRGWREVKEEMRRG